MKILVIGAAGMLGHSLFRYFDKKYDVIGTTRKNSWHKNIFNGYDATEFEKLSEFILEQKPDVIFNCVGIIKQQEAAKNNLVSIEVNSLFPHKLASFSLENNIKVIHFSTDCVFSGKEGNYTEDSNPDSRDLYGLSKLMGEIKYENSLTLRTSIIGHELNSSLSLIDWFLSQNKKCKGFSKAIFSGFPTNSLARIIDEVILKNFLAGKKYGLYHLSSDPIDKYSLLKLVADKYNKEIEIYKEDSFVIDRSLNSSRFRSDFNFSPRGWSDLVDEMFELYQELKENK